ncbi:maleylpyruvate isomerase family mycothiol-dependent enzyme [Sphaerisporangium sp. NPDC088356]|uniref:maleylpyruvate isomerase family mycothiol-dependent enzyme n=1 Tax=Sphaerisporangium sp. NPDC088356 TaxID=3154871 RepID=UPI0034350C14
MAGGPYETVTSASGAERVPGTSDTGTASASGWERVPEAVAYRQVRENLSRLLTSRPDAGGIPVAACPEWTVRDVIAHLVEICARVTGRSGERPAAEAPSGGDAGLADLLAAWADAGEQVERLVAAGAARRAPILVMDAFTHELDVRHALGVPPPAGHPAYPGALDVVVSGFSAEVDRRGLPPLRIETDGTWWVAGQGGPPVATLGAPRHDLLRSLAGRRTHAQIAELSWSEDPGPWLPAFAWGPFVPPERPAEDAVS